MMFLAGHLQESGAIAENAMPVPTQEQVVMSLALETYWPVQFEQDALEPVPTMIW
jgi:hypothetical protein